MLNQCPGGKSLGSDIVKPSSSCAVVVVAIRAICPVPESVGSPISVVVAFRSADRPIVSSPVVDELVRMIIEALTNVLVAFTGERIEQTVVVAVLRDIRVKHC